MFENEGVHISYLTVSRHLLSGVVSHQLLTYLPKRMHFHTKTFQMCMNLAVMDWVNLLCVMGPVIYNQTFRMKTLNGWLLMNIWMFVNQTIILRTMYWSRKHTALLRTSESPSYMAVSSGNTISSSPSSTSSILQSMYLITISWHH